MELTRAADPGAKVLLIIEFTIGAYARLDNSSLVSHLSGV
jgi:hypothetical protein